MCEIEILKQIGFDWEFRGKRHFESTVQKNCVKEWRGLEGV